MSTKIYIAYVVPISDLNGYLRKVKEVVYETNLNRLGEYLENQKVKSTWFDLIREMQETSRSLEVGYPLDFDYGLNVWLLEDFAYIIPVEGWLLPGRRASMDISHLASDFSYWDNVDPPDNIPEDEWDERGDLWDIIIGDGYNDTRLYYSIIDMSSMSYDIEWTQSIRRKFFTKE